MYDIIFFHATGRSGTQWFAKQLQRSYGDLAVVTHEPIQYAYQPKRFLRRYDAQTYAEMLALPQVNEHIEYIESTSKNKLYIEIGFPSYAAIPALYNRFGSRLKLVHLVRHPVLNAASQVTHGWYDPVRRRDMAEAILLTPEHNVHQWYYKSKWNGLTPFEKCLFFWSEFHLHSLELHERFPAMAYSRIRFEDIFSSAHAVDALQSLVGFMGLPWRNALTENLQQKEDQWPRKVARLDNWQDIYNHPQALALALQFGYDLDSVTNAELNERYVEAVSLFQKVRKRVQERLADLP